ncbi:small integral membrane protein 3-like [Heterocephalus glaber]|uniref:Small integral membrane protein 3-like n=1 Tax=Heterocephalus glaber TaxID=10181 RepID=A0AAX6QSX1_HETGA|nr:small integral membrane protein 3-like [Heterocephalus glaber]
MDAISQCPAEAVLPKRILDIWVIVLIILATTVIMTSLLCPATAVIIYRMRTHPVLSGASENHPRGQAGDEAAGPFSQPVLRNSGMELQLDLCSDFDSAAGQLCEFGQAT